MIIAETGTVDSACGIGWIGYFVNGHQSDDYPLIEIEPSGGAKFTVVGFINTNQCKEAYRILAERFKILYQSPVRVNENTGNRFFFVVYDTKED